MLESEMAAAVAGGVTSLVCPPDTDPVLDEPGLVEMLKFRAEKLHQARVFPLGALTRDLAGRGADRDGGADRGRLRRLQPGRGAAGQHAGAAARAAVRGDLRLHGLAAAAGCAPRAAAWPPAAPLATRLGLSGVPVAAETIALHTIFELMRATGARVHLCRLQQRRRRGAGARAPRTKACRSPATSASTHCT